MKCSNCENTEFTCVCGALVDASTGDGMTSLGLTRQELRAEIDELIRNAYAEGWREAKERPDVDPPALEIHWGQPGGVQITEMGRAKS